MTQPNAATDLIANADGRIRDLLNRFRVAVRDANGRIGANPNLSTEGQAQAMREARANLTAQYGQELADLRDQVERLVTNLRTAAAAMLPKPAGGVEGILGRQAQWARARSLFIAGYRSQDVIASATDPEMLHALREELPTAIAAGIAHGFALDVVNPMIDRRLADLTSPAASAALSNAQAAEIAYAGLVPQFQYAEAEITGRAREASGLSSAIEGARLRQLATLRLRPIENDTDVDQAGSEA